MNGYEGFEFVAKSVFIALLAVVVARQIVTNTPVWLERGFRETQVYKCIYDVTDRIDLWYRMDKLIRQKEAEQGPVDDDGEPYEENP
jgi:hypothetical protein